MSEMHDIHSNDGTPRKKLRGDTPVVASAAGFQSQRRIASAAPRLNPQFVLHALRRWWRLALPASVLMAGLGGAAAWLLFVPKYEASAWFHMEEKSPFLAFQNREEDRAKSFFQTQVEIVRSPLVLGSVFTRPEIAQLPEFEKVDDKIAWLAKQLQVNSVGQSELFTIRFAGSRPASAVKIVNAVADAYFELRDENESERIQRVLDLLEKEKERRSQEVFQLHEGLRDLAKQVTGCDPYAAKSERDTTAKSPLADLQTRLYAVQIERAVLEARLKAAEHDFLPIATSKVSGSDATAASTTAPLTEQEGAYLDAMVDKAIAENPDIKQGVVAILAAQAKLADIEAALVRGKEAPAYKRVESEIERDQQFVNLMRREIRPHVAKEIELSLQARRTETEAVAVAKQTEELSHLRTDLKARTILEQTLREEYEKGIEEVKQTSGDTLELEFKRDELTRAEKVFELIAQRALEIQTERGAPARVSLLKLADEPTAPIVSPLRSVSIAAVAGLLCPFVLAIGWERLAKRVGDTQDIEQMSHMKVLGEITTQPSRAGSTNHATPRSQECLRLFEESIDSLRTTLMLAEEFRDMNVLAVTSAAKHEGKTSVATQLAISLARATGQRVLLVDGDMRSPDIHRVFNVPRSPGLAEVLNDKCLVGEAIFTSRNENLDLLPAGKLTMSPHRLLGTGKWMSVLTELKAQYRYVVIDTPPTLAASESLMLAKGADATLVCAMRDVSRTDQVRQVCERLVTSGARPLGMVLNGVPIRRYAYRYGTYATTTV